MSRSEAEAYLRKKLGKVVSPVTAAVYARAIATGDTRGDPNIVRLAIAGGGGLRGGLPGLRIELPSSPPQPESP